MPNPDDLSADHITWLVKSRSANQELSLKLYLVMKDNAEAMKKNWGLANNAQALAGACFSLWRAVFLSDVSDDDQFFDRTITDAQSFLGNLILHNMVAYPQDRSTRDWTFVYYVNNAKYRLETISKENPEIVPSAFIFSANAINKPKDFWEYYHNACVAAVRNLERKLREISN